MNKGVFKVPSELQLYFSLFIILFFTAFTSTAARYYVSSSTGSDSNNGQSTNNPFQTLNAVNDLDLLPGDTVFLKRGDKFHGTLRIDKSGNASDEIVITSYSNGNLPVITGAKTISEFQPNGELMKVTTENPVYAVFIDDQFVLPARYPNSDYLYFDGGGRDFMIDSENPKNKFDLTRATIRMRIKNWSYENKKVVRVNEDTVFFDRPLWSNNYEKYVCEPGWGYFLDNNKEFIDGNHDWAFDDQSGSLHIQNPEMKAIEISNVEHGLILNEGVSHFKIEHVVFEKFYQTGILMHQHVQNITISECEFRNIFLKGIKALENTKMVTISSCKLEDILGQGISVLEGNNFLIENNLLKRIGLQPGYGIDGNNGGMGIIITNNETRPEGYTTISHNNIIRKNRVDSVGNYAIRMDGKNSLCEYNHVSNGLLSFNDGALIYSWGMDPTFSNHNIIQNNIVTKTHGNMKGTPHDHLISIGIYIDNNVNNVIVRNNTVTHANMGILFNSKSFENQAHNNILFDNTSGISFSEYHKGEPIYGMEVKNNTIVGLDYDDRALYSKSFVHSSLDPGVIDSNFYYNPKVEFFINAITTYETFRRDEEMSLKEWQKRGFDLHSETIDNNGSTQRNYSPQHFINYEYEAKEIPLDDGYQYFNLSEEPITSVSIPPFSSVVVLRNLSN